MANEKKELIKKFNVVVEDLLDHYKEYTDEEKAQVKELFQMVSDLNVILDKYDIEIEFGWQDYFDSYNRYFGAI